MTYNGHLSFFSFFSFLRHISRPKGCISHFHIFRCLAIFQVLHCAYIMFKFFNISRHISLPKECYSHFHDFQFSCNIPSLTVDISHLASFSVFHAIFHVLKGVFLIFHIFSYLAIFQVLLCIFIIFHVFNISLLISLTKECYSHFS